MKKILYTNKYQIFYFLIMVLFNHKMCANFDSGNAQSISVQSDGKIIAVGNAIIDNNNQIGIARYNTYGQLDLTFGNNGFLTSVLGAQQTYGNALLVDVNDKLIVVGSGIINNVSNLLVARFNNDGTIDVSFGNSGITFSEFADGANGNGIVVQNDGSLVVSGALVESGTPKMVIARYTSSGLLDTGFGSNGSITVQVGSVSASNAIALQPNGQIIAGGFSVVNGLQSFVLVRLNTDGSLDNSFGNEGIVSTPTGLGDAVRSLVLQLDGKIIVGGSSGNNFGLVRYNQDGSIDTSFGSNGVVVQSIGSYAQINGIALQTDGKIVAAGYSDSYFALARFNVDGSIDTSFGSNGVVTTSLSGPDAAQSLLIQSDGKIIAGGSAGNNFGLVRYNTDGSIDVTFGIEGIVIAPNNAGAGVFGITDLNIDPHANIAYEKLNLSNSIINTDIKSNAAIQDTKLATIQTPGKILNQATTATPNNIPGAIVSRDAIGNIYANRVYASLNGNVVGYATSNVLKAGDTMSGSLILPSGSVNVPSLQFSGSTNSGLSCVSDTLTLSTNGAASVQINSSGNVVIGSPVSGVGLTINGGGQSIVGDINTTGEIIYNTADQILYPIGSSQSSLIKLFTGSANTTLSGSVTIDYSAAGFSSVPLIFTQVTGGALGSLAISNIGLTSAVISNAQLINTNFNYLAIGA